MGLEKSILICNLYKSNFDTKVEFIFYTTKFFRIFLLKMHSTCKTIPYGKNGTSPIKTIFRCICDSLAFSQTRFFVFIHPSPSLLKCKYIRKIKFLFLKYPNHPFITPKLFIFYILYISKKVLVRSRYRPGMDRVYLKS
jgi:hypothetical protein